MTHRTYPQGVPCWIDTEQPGVEAAAEFYAGLFGWTFQDAMPAGAPGRYLIAVTFGAIWRHFVIAKWRAARERGRGLIPPSRIPSVLNTKVSRHRLEMGTPLWAIPVALGVPSATGITR